MRRRGLLTAGAALAAAPAALAAEDPDQGATEFLPPPTVFEQSFHAICSLAIAGGKARRGELEPMRDRAEEHVVALERVLRGFGATPPKRPAKKEFVPLPGFYEAESREEYLTFALSAAQGSVAAWYVALGQLRQPDLLRLGTAAMAADAQHVERLRRLLGQEPLQPAFETGRPQ